MKNTSLLTVGSVFVVGLLASNARANAFRTASVVDGVGVNVNFQELSNVADPVTVAKKWRAAGASVVRVGLPAWAVDDYNGSPDSYHFNFASLEKFVDACAKADIRVYASLGFPSDSYCGSCYDVCDPKGSHYDKDNPENCKDCAHDLANCYGSSVFRCRFNNFVYNIVKDLRAYADNLGLLGDYFTWELWNEPNGDAFWPRDQYLSEPDQTINAASQYMQLAMGVYNDIRECGATLKSYPTANQLPPESYTVGALEIIRKADPGATIVAPDVASYPDQAHDPTLYLETCFGYGPGLFSLDENNTNRIDGISVHFYRDSNPETVQSESVPSQNPTYELVDYLKNYFGGQNIPVISGEWGYSAQPGSAITNQVQADYLQRMMLTNFSQHIPLSIWYEASDQPDFNDFYFGLLDVDGTPKPSFYAMKTLTQSLANGTFKKAIDVDALAPPNARWLVFRAPYDTLVAWNTDDTITMNDNNGGWGTYLLTGTPLYVGTPLIWDGGYSGVWSNRQWMVDNERWGWVSGFQAQFDQNYPNTTVHDPVLVNVDGTDTTISGIQFNNNVNIYGGMLRFTPGGGNIYVGNNYFDSISSVIADAADRTEASDPITFTNTPETFALRKSGGGEVGLDGNNTFHGRVLVGEGILDLGSNQALGDQSNPVTLTGGGIDLNGHNLTTGPLTVTGDSTIYNYGPNASTYVPESFDINKGGNLSLMGGPAITIGGPITVNSGGQLTIAGAGAVNVGGIQVYEGAVYQNSSGTFTPAGILIKSGTLAGTGTIAANISPNSGNISPGFAGANSLGKLSVQGNVTISALTSLDIDLSGTSNDVLAMSGSSRTLTCGGKLNIQASGTVINKNKYHIITGTRSNKCTLTMGDVPSGFRWSLSVVLTGVQGGVALYDVVLTPTAL